MRLHSKWDFFTNEYNVACCIDEVSRMLGESIELHCNFSHWTACQMYLCLEKSTVNSFPQYKSVCDCTRNEHFFDDLLRFDTSKASWERLRDLPHGGRANHTANVINREVWVIGGNNRERVLQDVVVLNLDTLEWTCPKLRGDVDLLARTAHACDVHPTRAGCLILYGGCVSKGAHHMQWLNDFVVIDTLRKEVQCVSDGAESSGNIGRGYHSLVSIAGRCYVFGGRNAQGPVKAPVSLAVFDPSTCRWSCPPIIGNCPAPRSSHRALQVKGTMMIYGGTSGSRNGIKRLDDCHLLLVSTHQLQWKKTIPLDPMGSKPDGRAAHSLTLIGETVYVLYGHCGSRASSTFAADCWSCKVSLYSGPSENKRALSELPRHESSRGININVSKAKVARISSVDTQSKVSSSPVWHSKRRETSKSAVPLIGPNDPDCDDRMHLYASALPAEVANRKQISVLQKELSEIEELLLEHVKREAAAVDYSYKVEAELKARAEREICLEQELSTCRAESQTHKNLADQYLGEVKNAEKTLRATTEKLASLQNENTEIRKQERNIKECQQKLHDCLKEKEMEYAKLQTQLASAFSALQSERVSWEKSATLTSKMVDDLRQENSELKLNCQQMQDSLARVSKSLENAEARLVSESKALSECKDKASADAKAQASAFEELQQRHQALESQYQSMADQRRVLQSAGEKADTELAAVKQKLKVQEQRCAQESAEAEMLRAQVQQLRHQNQALKDEINAAETDFRAAELHLKSLKSRLQTNAG